MSDIGRVLEKLQETVRRRKREMPEGSYTAELFRKGKEEILKKLGEEAVETVLALCTERRESAIYETADLLYHLTVALVSEGISWEEIAGELERRMK